MTYVNFIAKDLLVTPVLPLPSARNTRPSERCYRSLHTLILLLFPPNLLCQPLPLHLPHPQ